MNISFAEFADDLISEQNGNSFGCLMAMLSPDLSSQFIEWAFDNIDPELVIYKDGVLEYEYMPHITIACGFHDNVNHEGVFNCIKDFGPITLTYGKITKFKQESCDVLKIDVESNDLHRLNTLLSEKFESLGLYTSTHPEYIPHQTLAYVKTDSCEELVNSDIFEGLEIVINDIVYSYPDSKRKIQLTLKQNIDEAIYGEPSALYNPDNKKTGEFVSAAAVKDLETGDIYMGSEHALAAKLMPNKEHNFECGFMTNKNRFLSRQDAMELAKQRRQVSQAAQGKLDSRDFVK